MLWNELLRKGNMSLLQSQSDTQYCVCRNYNPNEKEDQQYERGAYYCYWGDSNIKMYMLSFALEDFREKAEENYISKYRMEELVCKFAKGLIQDDKESAIEYFTGECEMATHEMEFFGIKTGKQEDEKI